MGTCYIAANPRTGRWLDLDKITRWLGDSEDFDYLAHHYLKILYKAMDLVISKKVV